MISHVLMSVSHSRCHHVPLTGFIDRLLVFGTLAWTEIHPVSIAGWIATTLETTTHGF